MPAGATYSLPAPRQGDWLRHCVKQKGPTRGDRTGGGTDMTAIHIVGKVTWTLGAALWTLGTRAWSETFPACPIKVIVPFGAWRLGRHDNARTFAGNGTAAWPTHRCRGASWQRGDHRCSGCRTVKSDGYTLLLGTTNNFVINQFMFPKQPVDPLSSLTLITKLVSGPLVVYVNPGVPARTFGEFISYAKAHPGKLKLASPGVGTAPAALPLQQLKQLAEIDLVHVPFHGAPEAMQALLENQVQLYLAGWVVGRSYVESGAIRALAVAAGQRTCRIYRCRPAQKVGCLSTSPRIGGG